MLTKTKFAKAIMRKFAISELGQDWTNIDCSQIQEADILKSSCLAVAMEYLGLIQDDDLKTYASSRGGSIFQSFDPETEELDYISARDLINMLPEE